MKDAYINAPQSFRLEVLKELNITNKQIEVLSLIHLIDIYETTLMDETIDEIFKHSLRQFADDFIVILLAHKPKSRLINRILDSRYSPESWVDLPYSLPLRF